MGTYDLNHFFEVQAQSPDDLSLDFFPSSTPTETSGNPPVKLVPEPRERYSVGKHLPVRARTGCDSD